MASAQDVRDILDLAAIPSWVFVEAAESQIVKRRRAIVVCREAIVVCREALDEARKESHMCHIVRCMIALTQALADYESECREWERVTKREH